MDHDAFRTAFESCSLERSDWDHRAHLRLAWLYLQEHDLDAALARMRDGIRRFDLATAPDLACNYHESMTRFWLTVIARSMEGAPTGEDFDAFCARCPELLDKRLILAYYTQPRIVSDEARERWVEPDRRRL